jgi:hypothetical protein
MIKEEIIEIGGKEFVRHYTDEPIYDEQGIELPRVIQVETGIEFIDAVDVIPCPYTYEEKPSPEPKPEPNEELGEQEAAGV